MIFPARHYYYFAYFLYFLANPELLLLRTFGPQIPPIERETQVVFIYDIYYPILNACAST